MPHFGVAFGQDPIHHVASELEAYTGQSVEDLHVLDVMQHLSTPTTQTINIVYTAKLTKPPTEQVGRYMLTKKTDLDKYVFPEERNRLYKMLKMIDL